MDTKAYYRKIKEIEDSIEHENVVVVSEATPDGGKAGVRTEVPRKIAARIVVEGRARLASDEETEEFRTETSEAYRKAMAALAAAPPTPVLVYESRPIRPTGRGSRS
ncbi:MAG: hypothetical protein ACK5AZ_11640 [Bryobacteraceae bacterium]